MTEQELIKRLEEEGYQKVWIHEAEPSEEDPEHKHEYDTKLHILSGEIRIKILQDGVIRDFLRKVGDEIEIPRGELHSAKVGVDGCRYVVAERI